MWPAAAFPGPGASFVTGAVVTAAVSAPERAFRPDGFVRWGGYDSAQIGIPTTRLRLAKENPLTLPYAVGALVSVSRQAAEDTRSGPLAARQNDRAPVKTTRAPVCR